MLIPGVHLRASDVCLELALLYFSRIPPPLFCWRLLLFWWEVVGEEDDGIGGMGCVEWIVVTQVHGLLNRTSDGDVRSDCVYDEYRL